jgi:hypothetical protein
MNRTANSIGMPVSPIRLPASFVRTARRIRSRNLVVDRIAAARKQRVVKRPERPRVLEHRQADFEQAVACLFAC